VVCPVHQLQYFRFPSDKGLCERQTLSGICVKAKSFLPFPEFDLYLLSRPTLVLVSLQQTSLKFRIFRDDDDDDNDHDNDDENRTFHCVLRFKVVLIVFKR
jgi:hypothetical protein